MKKPSKKLSITSETLRTLSPPAIDAVAGGLPTVTRLTLCDCGTTKRSSCPTIGC